ncbi:TRAP transporter small permease [Microbacterium sp.]|uniref:TRAP transporter small permease n=1 Tax=Microbacterium sp. TaxID=51671 RepID=UPI002CA9E05A|nr:TRAP transporter small permease subunit [Microbacterium sp.]HWK77747.1 TRAP transporter small permease subunit [Microbacterium sp.]
MSDFTVLRAAPVWRRLVGVLTVLEITIGAVCLLFIAVLVFFQALQRYLPIPQVAWTGEISQFCLAWLTFSVMGVLITTGGHITLEILDSLKNQLVVRVIQVVAMLLSVSIAVLLVVEAVHLIQTQGVITSSVLRIPMSWAYVPILVGLISAVIRGLIQAIRIALTGPILADVDDDEAVLA